MNLVSNANAQAWGFAMQFVDYVSVRIDFVWNNNEVSVTKTGAVWYPLDQIWVQWVQLPLNGIKVHAEISLSDFNIRANSFH